MANYCKLSETFIKSIAPTLCGIKPANLFSLSAKDFSESIVRQWKYKIEKQNLCLVSFRTSINRWMFFIYDLAWIRKLLSDDLIQAYLRGKGYSDPLDTLKTLDELFSRLKKHTGFPHEVGLFLGYPFEDVISFEQNSGHNCKYCGFWKSYTNPSAAELCCRQYKMCSQMCRQWFEEGLSVPQIIKQYKETVKRAV